MTTVPPSPLPRRELAIVTGAGSGLGRAIAVALAQEGWHVVLAGRRRAALEATAKEAAAQTLVCAADVTLPAGRAAIVQAGRVHGPVRFLVHGAGIHPLGPIEAVTAAEFRETLATNVEARFFLTRDLLPWFAPEARVLFLGSNSATRARLGGTAYCVAQAGSLMLHECLKNELAPRGVRVGSAIPSPAHTPMVDAQLAADPAVYPDARIYRELQAAGRLIAPATVARFVCWLLRAPTAEEYGAKEWRVTDESHHPHWLGTDLLTPPCTLHSAPIEPGR
jgi:meso-butanediol dehydrogenase/(S,S)-butanediol dehydrogenase/diacetyl reductase